MMRILWCAVIGVTYTAGACMQGPPSPRYPPPEHFGHPPPGLRSSPPPVSKAEPDLAYLDFLFQRRQSEPDSQRESFAAWYGEKIADAEGAERDRLEREHKAVRDILMGNHPWAIEALLAIEEDYPGHYSTASTLGTAYELAGDNTNALHWIKTGIERNPDSHYGTEWLHVRILEAKIAMEEDPRYLADHAIIPAAAGSSGVAYGSRSIAPGELLDALHFQLGERMLFVKPEDPVVADLLHTYAVLDPVAASAGLTGLAGEYGYGAEEEPAMAVRMWRHLRETWLPVGVCASVLGLVLFLKFRA